jgi:very-short-patch-repair endonuclease
MGTTGLAWGETLRRVVPYPRMSSERNRDRGKEGRYRPLAEIATAQGGVVSLDQLRGVEVTQRAASYRTEQGGMHRVHRAVYAVGHRSIDRVAVLRAALLACGEGSVVSHGTAAAFWGLRDPWPVLVDVIVPCEAGRKIDGIRCRRCRYPSPEEIVTDEGVAYTTPARTIVDLAGILGTASLRRVIERAAVLNRLDVTALDASLRRAEGRPGVKALRAIADEWRTDDGSVPDLRSDFEALVLPRLLERGLPRPACNKTLRIDGQLLMVDFLWEEERVIAETDGQQTHGTPVAFQRDRWRDQILVAAGYRVARITWDQIRDELDAVVERIARALGSAHG